VLAYVQLQEMDRLTDAAAIDARYHQAKLMAAAFAEPDRIWEEHEQVRTVLLRPAYQPPPKMSDEHWLEAVARIHRKLQKAGLVKPDSGVMN